MKIVKSNGLAVVRVISKDAFLDRQAGEVFGMLPVKALASQKAGHVEIIEPSGDVETEDYVPVAEPEAPATAPIKAEDEAAVSIPANWADLHHLQQIALAKKIDPAAEVKNKADAVAVIEAAIKASAEA